ncbi:MAG: dockerin type I domain-containing protein, partial [Bacteroidota bacterium]
METAYNVSKDFDLRGGLTYTKAEITSGANAGRTGLCSFDLNNTGQVTAWVPNPINTFGKLHSIITLAAFNNQVYAGGDFFGVKCNNNYKPYIAAINAVTGVSLIFNPYTNGLVRTFHINGNYLYVGGDFTEIQNWGTNTMLPRNRIAQVVLGTNGSVTGWNPDANGSVLSIASKGLYIYAGGTFSTIGGNPRPRLSAIKISDGTSSTWTPSPNDTVKCLVVGGDTLYVGGDFTNIAATTRNRIASFSLTGNALNSFDPNANGEVNAIAFKNNKLFTGGTFTTIAGASRNRFASINVKTNAITSLDPLSSSSENISVSSLFAADSAIYLSGKFMLQNFNSNLSNPNVCAVKINNSNRSKWWHPDPNGTVRAMFLYQDKLYLGGDFTESLNIYQPFFTCVDNFCTVDNVLPVPADTNFCQGDSVPLWATPGAGYKYQWYKDNVILTGATKRYYIPIATGWYKALITDTINYGSLYTNARHVTVDPLAPTTITNSGSLIFCGSSGQSVILTAASGTGYSYQWFKNNVVIGGANSINYTATSSGFYFCVVYNASGCPKQSQTVAVNSTGLSPVMSLTGSNPFCQGTTVTLSSNFSTGYFHQWYKDNVKLQGSTGQALIVSTAGTYKVRDSIGTCAGFSNEMTLAVNPLPGPAVSISGEDTICPGVTTATYFVNPITYSESYIWTIPAGATGTSTGTSINVTYGAGFTGGQITVKGHNSCGDGVPASLTIAKGLLPANAGTITGQDTICPGVTSAVYSVAAITDAVAYIWTLPTGMTGNSATNSINVTISPSFNGGQITVKGHNYCGNGAQSSKTIVKGQVPAAAGTITGNALICPGVASGVYSVAAVAGATSYIWTLPAGVTGNSNTNTITVAYGGGFTGGQIAVRGHNLCADGTASTLTLTPGQAPGAAGDITGPVTVFRGSTGIEYSVNPVTGASSYIWTLPAGATGTSVTNTISVSFGYTAVSGNITVKAHNLCGDGAVSTLFVNVELPPPQFAPVTTAGTKGVPDNAPVTIPVTVTGFDTITSLSLRMDYDPNVLTFTGYSNANPVLAGLIVNDNHVSASLHKIIFTWSDINPKSLPAASKIVDVNFTHLTGNCDLIWNNESNGGGDCEYADKNGDPLWDIPTSQFYINGQIFLQTGYKVSGNFVYNNSANTALDNLKVYLKLNSVKLDSAVTNSAGHYEFSVVQDNIYTLEGSTAKPWTGINGTDALKIQRHFAGIEIFTEPVRLKAADVNLSYSINGTDALKVKRRFAGLDNSFARGDWTF